MRTRWIVPVTAVCWLTSSFSFAADPCPPPARIDFGADAAANREALARLFRAVKTFQRESAVYRECLDGESDRLGEAEVTQRHNASIDAEEAVAKRFNIILAEFKQRNSVR